MPKANPKTAADQRFETYLDDRDVPFLYEPPWAALFGIDVPQNPDFLVDQNRSPVIAEVKQFETKRTTERLRDAGGTTFLDAIDVFGPIRSKMTESAEQLRPFAPLGLPLVAVLANPLDADVDLDYEHVAHAILGNPKLRLTIGHQRPPDTDESIWAADYGAFCSMTPEGRWVNHSPHVSAVVVVHERTHEQDWSDRTLGFGPRFAYWAKRMRGMPPRDDAPSGSYRWVDVYDLSGNLTPPGFRGGALPRRLFDGPLDVWHGFVAGGARFDRRT
jgi:hypothetical protein